MFIMLSQETATSIV